MKKILFNDKFSLTQAVLEGRKTQTRRIIPRDFFTLGWDERGDTLVYENDFGDFIDIRNSKYANYKLGEVVAVAQSYKDCGFDPEAPLMEANGMCGYVKTRFAPGWNNKLFVRADLMPHRIRITNVRVERLHDISDEDCLKEGIIHAWTTNDGTKIYHTPHTKRGYLSTNVAQEAYAALIDRISGKGVWQSNPYVFVYDFELVNDSEKERR